MSDGDPRARVKAAAARDVAIKSDEQLTGEVADLSALVTATLDALERLEARLDDVVRQLPQLSNRPRG